MNPVGFLGRESVFLPFVLLILSLAVWSEMDLFAPSLPDAMRYFKTTEAVIQWTFSLNFFGFFISSLFCGALSDALGRRKVLLGGTALFVLGSGIVVMAESIEVFLLGRLLQGIGVGAPAVVTMAIMADIYQGAKFIRWMSVLNCLVSLVMALAPIFGAYLNIHYGWRSNFSAIAILAVVGFVLNWVYLPETLPREHRKPFEPRQIFGNYKRLLQSSDFCFPMFGLCCLVAPYFVYVSIIPLLFLNEIHLSMQEYVWCQFAVVGTFSALSLFLSWFGSGLNLVRWNRVSIRFAGIIALLLLLVGVFMDDSPWVLTVAMSLLAGCMVIPAVVLYSAAVSVYEDLQASSVALFQAVRMFMMSLGITLSGWVYNGYYAPVGLITGAYIFLGVFLISKVDVKDVSRMVQAGH